jgi:hypothetical protein
MDTIRAVAHLAAGRERGSEHGDPTSPNFGSPSMESALITAIDVLDELGMRPADDRATQTRLAAATDRASSARVEPDDLAATIMKDYMLQEAAAARMAATGRIDPLSVISDPTSDRQGLDAANRLKDMAGIHAHAIFDRASPDDMAAMAAGRYDQIVGGNTAFALSTQLKMSAETITTEAGSAGRRETPAKGPAAMARPMPTARSASR